MKGVFTGNRIYPAFAALVVVCLLCCPLVWAAAGDTTTPEWRLTYDQVMLWVNFLILVAVIVKYGRIPIKKFLEGQKSDIQAEIEQIERDKEKIKVKVADAVAEGKKSRIRLEQLKERIKAQGENKRRKIIEDANRQSVLLIEDVKRKIGNRIQQARDELKSEVVDIAIAQAVKRLPEVITHSDNQSFVDQYLEKANM